MSLLDSRYGQMIVIDSDDLISNSLRLYGEWAQKEIDLLAQFIHPGSIVVDAGAYIGTHARAFSALVGPNGKVFAFEPRLAAFAVLFENARLSSFANIDVINSALGSEETEVVVQLVENCSNFGALTLNSFEINELCGERVVVKTLDSFNFDHLNFIKLDVEGMEVDVLNGAKKTIARCRPIIFAECNSLEQGVKIFNFSQEEKYNIYGVISDAYNSHNYARNPKNIFGTAKETGVLLIPEEINIQFDEIILKNNLPQIKTADDLVLLLLHKPQYPYEVLTKSAAATRLSLAYPSPQANMLNELIGERDAQIASLSQAVTERDAQIASLSQAVTERDAQIASLNSLILGLNATIHEYVTSRSWRITAPIRMVMSRSKALYHKGVMIKEVLSDVNTDRLKKTGLLLMKGRFKEINSKLRQRFVANENVIDTDYSSTNLMQIFDNKSSKLFENHKRKTVDIVIPVYNGFEYLEPLFNSLLNHTVPPYRVIVVDDCSTDRRVYPFLENFSKRYDQFILIKNDKNLGFVGTVNRAVEIVKSDIFVILNSDIELPPNWLDRLIAPILIDKKVASTTPFSNSATICSFPNFVEDNELYLGLTVDQIDSAFSELPLLKEPIYIPTGVGFCMAINHRVVQKIGMFDPAFGRGYGEENDWCMRAAKAGYKHVLVNNLFVYHKHGGSFESNEKLSLIQKNHDLLLSRYPDYDQLVANYIKKDPAKLIREFIKVKLKSLKSRQGAILIIDHNMGGGANHYREELVKSFTENGATVLIFIDDSRKNVIYLKSVINEEQFVYDLNDIKLLNNVFESLKITKVIYNNAVASSDPLGIIELIVDLKSKYNFELVTLFHDFYPICPSYTLINKDGQYCGVPKDIGICKQCLPKIPSRYSAFIQPGVDIQRWRLVWCRMLTSSDVITCFSESSREIIIKAYPSVHEKIQVVPHKVFWDENKVPCINYSAPLHIGIVGGINYAKGLDVVLGLVKSIKKRNKKENKNIKITVFGEIDAVTPIDGLNVTGRYRKDDLPKLIETFGANIFLIPSICPETFSYVASELMLMDVPLVSFDIGAPAERISKYPKGMILPLSEANNFDVILDHLVNFYGRMAGNF